ncbi:hypothetical protein HOB85_05100 [Candidatus Woesearchaeota archaeon]|nr:hypothetical protein [Candidatus Woesearchaeota archaeon]
MTDKSIGEFDYGINIEGITDVPLDVKEKILEVILNHIEVDGELDGLPIYKASDGDDYTFKLIHGLNTVPEFYIEYKGETIKITSPDY